MNYIELINNEDITDEIMLELYKKNEIDDTNYIELLSLLAHKKFYKTCLMIIRNKVNKENIDPIIKNYKDNYNDDEGYTFILDVLEEIQSETLISLTVDKEPLYITLSSDNIINITGQSGSGKSTYSKRFMNDDNYIVVDTDNFISDNNYNNSKGIDKELGYYLRSKYEVMPNLEENFDEIYLDIIEYLKKYNKTIVIDCAQFHCIKDINNLKGEIIIIRTCIDNCYKRCISRYKENNPNCTEKEISRYAKRKESLYSWYKGSNNFIEKIVSIDNEKKL